MPGIGTACGKGCNSTRSYGTGRKGRCRSRLTSSQLGVILFFSGTAAYPQHLQIHSCQVSRTHMNTYRVCIHLMASLIKTLQSFLPSPPVLSQRSQIGQKMIPSSICQRSTERHLSAGSPSLKSGFIFISFASSSGGREGGQIANALSLRVTRLWVRWSNIRPPACLMTCTAPCQGY